MLARELAPWFENHAATMDNMLAAFIQARGFNSDLPFEAQTLNLDGAIPAAASCASADCGATEHGHEASMDGAFCASAECAAIDHVHEPVTEQQRG